MKLSGTLVVFAIALHAILAPQTPAAEDPGRLRILISRDLRGWLVPCDCRAGVLGGFARRVTVITREKPDLLLDAGDLISQASPYDLLKLRLMLELDAKIGYAAVNIGRREAEFSKDEIVELSRSSRVPLISANLADEAGSLILRSHLLLEHRDQKVALVGLVSPDAHVGRGLRVLDPKKSLNEVLRQLQEKADFVILLAALKVKELERVLEDETRIDLVLGGWVPRGSERLESLSGVPCFLVQGKGQYLGEVTIEERDEGLVPSAGRRIVLSPDVPSEKSTTDRITAFKRSLKDLNLLESGDGPSPFIGSASCAACHGEIHASWRQTAHFRAIESLTPEKGRYDPQCLRCHVTAPGRGGYVSEVETPEFLGVGCESCHGPSRVHANAQLVVTRPRTPQDPRKVCLECHLADHSRPFHAAERLRAIRHWKPKEMDR